MKKVAITAVALTTALFAGTAFANKDWEDKFDKIDTNKDGVISKQEFDAHNNEWFTKMDTNKDGSISKDEKKAAKEAKKEKRD